MQRRKALKTLAGLATAGQVQAQPSRYSRAEQQRFMRRAAELRQQAVDVGDQPYGAVVVRDGQIIGLGPSRVVVNSDPTAHAEMEAIRDAAKRLNTRDLSGCELYSTSRPCKMCETAAYWAGISRMYFGTEIADAGPPTYPRC
jgi:tRNA(Arg) A34 adenosine deaminase TadA